jgi:cardiolipin synthase
VKLIIQPDDGVAPLVSAIKKAKKSVEIVIFRFDHGDIEAALKAAVDKGVKVTALIASANRGGKMNLRGLEMRFLEAGVSVARSANDLVRYHDKFILIDRRILHMLSFNYTHLDIDHSRGFGIVTKDVKWAQEAVKLFEADCTRSPYTPGLDTFVVSPANSRKVLSSFIKRAKRQLLIYDPRISDKEMVRILRDRAKAGVEIRVIGRIDERVDLAVKKPEVIRLHTRTIIRDRHQAFIGSQSLRPAELNSRRELGLIVRDAKVVKRLIDTFESDWASTDAKKEHETTKEEPAAAAKKEAEEAVGLLVRELHPLTKTVKKVVKQVVARAGEEAFEDKMVKNTLKNVVRKAVRDAVKEVQDNKKP